jgi:ferredoxin
MKAHVNKDSCIGCGLCEGLCPNVFKMGDDGLAEAIQQEVADADVDDTREAESQCPVGAIEIED